MKQIILFCCTLCILSCEKYEETPVVLANQFTLRVIDTAGVKADGRSVVGLLLTKTVEVKKSMKVVYTTNKGIIQNTELQFTNDSALVFLTVAQDTGNYYIKAQVLDGTTVIIEKTVSFALSKALPDEIALEPDKLLFNFGPNKQINISVYLLRSIGLVSKGSTVKFRAFQIGNTVTDTVEVGRFTGLVNNFSGADGKLLSNVVFYAESPNNIDSFKVVTLKAFSINNNNQEVSKFLTLTYMR